MKFSTISPRKKRQLIIEENKKCCFFSFIICTVCEHFKEHIHELCAHVFSFFHYCTRLYLTVMAGVGVAYKLLKKRR